MEPGKTNIAVFADTLLALARTNRDIMVVTSDSRGSGGLGQFARELPEQLVEVGIAEQNLVGVAAGLASAGKKVYAVSPACFLTARSLEQIKNDVAYSDNPVVLMGISAGVSYGALGATHHALHDYAVLRAIHNLTIVAPADNLETQQAILAASRCAHPVYVRLGKRPMPHLHNPGTRFELGKAIPLGSGNDLTFVATGEPVQQAVLAGRILAQKGIACRVLSMHTLKPLDKDALLAAARETRALLSVEEHSIYGGLGEACAAALMEHGISLPFKIVAIPDEATVAGSQMEVYQHYGLAAEPLARTAESLLHHSGPMKE